MTASLPNDVQAIFDRFITVEFTTIDRLGQPITWPVTPSAPIGAPLQPGLACLTAHAHSEQFTWQQNFQLRGDLVFVEPGWALIPHRLVGGFELPRSRLMALRAKAAKARRFRLTVKRELARRSW